eukprot:7381011-Prymnesium_polylepis.3
MDHLIAKIPDGMDHNGQIVYDVRASRASNLGREQSASSNPASGRTSALRDSHVKPLTLHFRSYYPSTRRAASASASSANEPRQLSMAIPQPPARRQASAHCTQCICPHDLNRAIQCTARSSTLRTKSLC